MGAARIAVVAVAALALGLAAGGASGRSAGRFTFAPVVSGLSSPVYVTSAPGDPTTLYVVEQPGTIKIVRNGAVAGTFLDIRSRVKSRRRAGAPLGRVPPAVRDEPPLLRRLHRHERRHARRRVPLGERRRPCRRARASCSSSTSRTTTTTAGSSQFDRNGLPLRRHGRRRLGRRPGEPRAEPEEPARQAAAHQPDARGLGVADRRLRAPQPVAVLVRPRDRRPLDRRRRPGQLGGGRLPQRGARRQARELRLEPLRGQVRLRRAQAARPQGRSRSRPWPCTRTPRAARSPAATSTAARRCPPRRAATSTATTAAARSGAFTAGNGKTGAVRVEGKIDQLSSFGEDGNGELYAASLDGTIYRLR